MSDFTPLDGWVKVEANAVDALSGTWMKVVQDGKHLGYWVPENPIPPLPTEPYAVIRVTWNNGGETELVLWKSGAWGGGWTPGELAKEITGWKLLAEPCENHYGREDLNRAEEKARRATAKKIRERYDQLYSEGYGPISAIKTAIGDFL